MNAHTLAHSSVSAIALGAVVSFSDYAVAKAVQVEPEHESEVIAANEVAAAVEIVQEEPELLKAPATALADRAALTRALDIVANVVEKRNTIPILSNVSMIGDGANLTVTGTDLDIEIAVKIPAAADAHFAVTLPAHTMKDLLKKATASEFVGFTERKGESNAVTVDFEKVNYRLQDLPIADYPNLSGGNPSHSFTVPGADLVEAFGGVAIAISTEETRYYLNGVYLHHVEPRAIDAYHGDHGALRMVATDGHRLCRQDLAATEGMAGMPGVIIPRKTVALLQKLLKGKACPASVRIELSDQKLRLMFEDVTITTKLIDGSFPDYQRVIPTGNDKPATFKAADLAEGVRAVELISSERGRAVKLTFSAGNCQLAVNNPDQGSATANIATDYASDELEIGFNAKYVQDLIATAGGEEITLTMRDSGSPTVITTPDRKGWLGVLMPMRV
ncbi:DNA polymerase III subunit beta [Mesorhizobium sp.]|uniref:DNA polymerase III subunit beta n=1 Tax=Mesorhizobium sp. TaxID=1871066 RepID=UPI00120DCA50|nr:DNA polymerase III subunit beta [Mesorhizobium sp.]TIX28856.1 MAG: DNA polymerase III subunit beta [Mesorhizobium sp.]